MPPLGFGRAEPPPPPRARAVDVSSVRQLFLILFCKFSSRSPRELELCFLLRFYGGRRLEEQRQSIKADEPLSVCEYTRIFPEERGEHDESRSRKTRVKVFHLTRAPPYWPTSLPTPTLSPTHLRRAPPSKYLTLSSSVQNYGWNTWNPTMDTMSGVKPVNEFSPPTPDSGIGRMSRYHDRDPRISFLSAFPVSGGSTGVLMDGVGWDENAS